MTDQTREPMSRLSQQWRPGPDVGWGPAYWHGVLIRLAVVAAIAGGGWFVVASAYRSQHCVELFGHWLAMDRTADPWGFCQ